MLDKKNIIIAFGNKEFNNSLIEIKNYFNFDLKVVESFEDYKPLPNCQGFIIHEEAIKGGKMKDILENKSINKIIFHNSKQIRGHEDTEKLLLPATIDQINKIIVNNIIKKRFKTNSSVKINDYVLNKNLRKLIKNDLSLELTEKMIELLELLKKKSFTKKKEILATVWKYSEDSDTHTVETHIYRLRKKIKETFKDELFIKSEKKGYTI